MMVFVWMVLCWIAMFTCGTHGEHMADCRLYECASGECDATSHGCEGCETSPSDYNCQEITYDNTECSSCDEEGTYRLPNDSFPACNALGSCWCKEDFTGPTCSIKRAYSTCTATSMDIFVTPHNIFTGIMSLIPSSEDEDIDDTCVLSGNGNTEVTFSKGSFNYEDTDGSASCSRVQPNHDTATGIYSLRVYMQTSINFRASTDRIITFICVPPTTNDIIELPANDPVASVGGAHVGADEVAAGRIIPRLTLTINTFMGPASGSSTSFILGTDIGLYLDATQTVGVPDDMFSMKDCTAYNWPYTRSAVVPNNAMSLQLISDWCVTNEAISVVRFPGVTVLAQGDAFPVGGGTVSSTRVVVLELDLWWFRTADVESEGEITIVCTACLGFCDYSAVCDPSTHATYLGDEARQGVTQRVRRRRRTDDEGLDGSLTNFNVTVSVLNPSTSTANKAGEVTKDATCYTSLAFFLPIAVLIVALFFAMVMMFFFCIKLNGRQDKVEGNMNVGYKAHDAN